MRVRLNLATRPLQTHRKFLVGAGAVAAIAGLAFLILGWHVYSVRKADETARKRSEEMRADMAALNTRMQNLRTFFAQPENARLKDRSDFINGIIDDQSFNWTQMFMDLEKLMPAGVHVITIEPKQVKGSLQVRFLIGAASDEAKLKFLRAMENSHAFSHVTLVAERGAVQGSGTDQTVLDVTAVYLRG